MCFNLSFHGPGLESIDFSKVKDSDADNLEQSYLSRGYTVIVKEVVKDVV